MIGHHLRRNLVKEMKEKSRYIIFKDLTDKHRDKYTEPQLHLWTRMITNGLHGSLDNPLWVPMITGSSGQQKQEALMDARTGGPLPYAKVIAPSPSIYNPISSTSSLSPTTSTSLGLLPCKAADLWMNHLEQLRYIWQLMEDRIISESK